MNRNFKIGQKYFTRNGLSVECNGYKPFDWNHPMMQDDLGQEIHKQMKQKYPGITESPYFVYPAGSLGTFPDGSFSLNLEHDLDVMMK